MQMVPNAPSTRLVVVIDDDPMVLDGMSGLLRSWGYQVVTATTEGAALSRLAQQGQRPDLIICDYGLTGGKNGVQAIEQLRDAFEIPALIISGGVVPERPEARRPIRYRLMRKPVNPTALQAMLSQVLARYDAPRQDS